MKTYTVTVSNEVTKWYRDGALHEVGAPELPEEAADVWSTIEKPDSIQQLLRANINLRNSDIIRYANLLSY